MMTNCSEYCVLLEEVWIPAACVHRLCNTESHVQRVHVHIVYRVYFRKHDGGEHIREILCVCVCVCGGGGGGGVVGGQHENMWL